MATRWMKWNPTTHIFEYSTDGVTFGVLPLNASILTEGVVAAARLPPGLPQTGLPNVFTDPVAITIQNAAPHLRFIETDQTVDQKIWNAGISGSVLKLQSLTDALAATDLLTLDRNGVFSLTQNADHLIGGFGSGAAINRLRIRNVTSGAARYAELTLDTDLASQARLSAYPSGFTTAGYNVAAGITLEAAGSGGLNIAASNASGAMQFFTGGAAGPRMTILSGGGVDIVKSSDQATLRLYRNTPAAVSGSPEGGLLFLGLGIKHFGMGYIPATTGSRSYFGFGSTADIVSFQKNMVMYDVVTIANGATFNTLGIATALTVISSVSENKIALFLLNAAGSLSVEISDPGAGFSPTFNTAGMVNIYYAGGGIWTIQNLRGSTVNLMITMIGSGTGA